MYYLKMGPALGGYSSHNLIWFLMPFVVGIQNIQHYVAIDDE